MRWAFSFGVTKRPGQLPQAVYLDCWVFILRPSIFLAGTGMAALGTFRIWLLLLTTCVFEGKADIGITSAQVGVEARCGAVALGRTYLLPPLSSGGPLVVQP